MLATNLLRTLEESSHRFSDLPVLIYRENVTTYGEFWQAVQQMTELLRKRLRGERCLFVRRNLHKSVISSMPHYLPGPCRSWPPPPTQRRLPPYTTIGRLSDQGVSDLLAIPDFFPLIAQFYGEAHNPSIEDDARLWQSSDSQPHFRVWSELDSRRPA